LATTMALELESQSLESCTPDDLQQTCELAYLCLRDYPKDNLIAYGLLMLTSGLCWTCAYIIYIVACRDGTYRGVPFAALILNLSWEFVFSFVWIEQMGAVQRNVNRIWFFFDCFLFLQYARCAYLQNKSSSAQEAMNLQQMMVSVAQYTLLAVTLAAMLICLIRELHDYSGIYMAFGQNVVMSILFTWEIWNTITTTTKDFHFSSTVAAGTLRCVGTLAASLAIGQWVRASVKTTPLLMFLFVGCFVWDIMYVGTAVRCWYRQQKQPDE